MSKTNAYGIRGAMLKMDFYYIYVNYDIIYNY